MNCVVTCLIILVAVQLRVVPSLLAQGTQLEAQELMTVWSLPGPWASVVADERSHIIYAIGRGGGTIAVDLTGRVQRELRLGGEFGLSLRLAKLPGPTLLTFGVWGDDLRAYDLNGNALWTYPRATGIDDVSASDVDGDESDEVIVGYNGRTGLHVLDGTGHVRWTSTVIGNVWHVSVGDVLGEGTPQVVTTSSLGRVHVFSGDGKRRIDIRTALYANMVRVRKLGVPDAAATIIVGGAAASTIGGQSTVVAALSGDGGTKWTIDLGNDRIQSAELAPSRPWLAFGVAGRVHVVDTTSGEAIGQIAGQLSAQVAWAPTGDDSPPLLVVATGDALNAFRVGVE